MSKRKRDSDSETTIRRDQAKQPHEAGRQSPASSERQRFGWFKAIWKGPGFYVGGLLGVAATSIVSWGAPIVVTDVSARIQDAARAEAFPLVAEVELQDAFDSVILPVGTVLSDDDRVTLGALTPAEQAAWLEDAGGVVVGPRTLTLSLHGNRTRPVTLTGIRTVDECEPEPLGTLVRLRDGSAIREGSAAIRSILARASGESHVETPEGERYFNSPQNRLVLDDDETEALVIDAHVERQGMLCHVKLELTVQELDGTERTTTIPAEGPGLPISSGGSNPFAFDTVYIGGELCATYVLAADGCSTVTRNPPAPLSDPPVEARMELQDSDNWVALPAGTLLSDAEMDQLASVSAPDQVDWLVENAGGAVRYSREVTLILRGNRADPVRITDLDVVGECGDPPSGALVETHGGKGGEEASLPLSATFNSDSGETVVSGASGEAYFPAQTITLAEDEELVLDTEVSLVGNGEFGRTEAMCVLDLVLTVLDDDREISVPVPTDGHGIALFEYVDEAAFESVFVAGAACPGEFARREDIISGLVKCR
ncbi:hypothetical protein [Agromyces bauzanensis]